MKEEKQQHPGEGWGLVAAGEPFLCITGRWAEYVGLQCRQGRWWWWGDERSPLASICSGNMMCWEGGDCRVTFAILLLTPEESLCKVLRNLGWLHKRVQRQDLWEEKMPTSPPAAFPPLPCLTLSCTCRALLPLTTFQFRPISVY